MENFYTAYTQPVNGVMFYFVKHFQTFPEYKNVPPLLEHFGMHTNFYKACRIARIYDTTIQQQLSTSVDLNIAEAKVIHMHRGISTIYNFKNWHFKLPGLLRLVNLR